MSALKSSDICADAIWGVHVQLSTELPEAFAVLGFAFYVQPMLMPLLHEMPPGQASVGITCTAVRIVVGIVASVVRVFHPSFSLPVTFCLESSGTFCIAI